MVIMEQVANILDMALKDIVVIEEKYDTSATE